MIIPDKQNKDKILQILTKLERYSQQKNNNSSAVFSKCLLYQLLYSICQEVDNNQSNTESPKVIRPAIVTKILDYINGNLNKSMSIDFLSKQFYISSSYLCKLFNKYVGISVTQTIINCRLSMACKLLGESKKSMNDIAELCGFSSSNYFGLIFKKNIGLSPMNYRKYQNEKK